MDITIEDINKVVAQVRDTFNKLKEMFKKIWERVKKAVIKLQIHKYWDNKELRRLVYIKQRVKTKRLKKKYDDKIKRFIFRRMQLKQ